MFRVQATVLFMTVYIGICKTTDSYTRFSINEVLLKAIHVVNNTSTVVYLLNRSQAAVNNFLIVYEVNYQTLSRLNMVGKPLRIMHEINTDKITSHCIRQVVNPTRQHGKLDNVSLPAVKQNWHIHANSLNQRLDNVIIWKWNRNLTSCVNVF